MKQKKQKRKKRISMLMKGIGETFNIHTYIWKNKTEKYVIEDITNVTEYVNSILEQHGEKAAINKMKSFIKINENA